MACTTEGFNATNTFFTIMFLFRHVLLSAYNINLKEVMECSFQTNSKQTQQVG
jgi:hypothetical protein